MELEASVADEAAVLLNTQLENFPYHERFESNEEYLSAIKQWRLSLSSGKESPRTYLLRMRSNGTDATSTTGILSER